MVFWKFSNSLKLEEGDPQKLDVGDKLNLLFEDASTNYNNVMAMLPLAIEDISFSKRGFTTLIKLSLEAR